MNRLTNQLMTVPTLVTTFEKGYFVNKLTDIVPLSMPINIRLVCGLNSSDEAAATNQECSLFYHT